MFLLRERRIALALLSGVIGAPIYHLLTGNPSGDQKHVVFGLLFMLPLIGVTLSYALRRWSMLIAVPALIGLAAFGAVQVVRIDEGWPDLRQSASLLVSRAHRGRNAARELGLGRRRLPLRQGQDQLAVRRLRRLAREAARRCGERLPVRLVHRSARRRTMAGLDQAIYGGLRDLPQGV